MKKNIKQLPIFLFFSILLITHRIDASENSYTQKIDITSLVWPQTEAHMRLLHPYMVSHYQKLLNTLRIRQTALLIVFAPELLKVSQ